MSNKRDDIWERLDDRKCNCDCECTGHQPECIVDFAESEVSRREVELTAPGETTREQDLEAAYRMFPGRIGKAPYPFGVIAAIAGVVDMLRDREGLLRAALRLANERAELATKAERARIVAWLREAPARMEAQRKAGALSLGASHEAGQLFACDQIANWLEGDKEVRQG